MPIEISFPDPCQSDDDGLVAVGGSLSVDFLLAAYAQGLFPWFNVGEPILWWSPNPRMLLYPINFKCSKSLKQILNSKKFELKVDENFEQVIRSCADKKRPDQKGTWLTPEMIAAYIALHKEGYAHSFETHAEGKLVGGLYGVSLGKAFFGESMFFYHRDASKVALYHLSNILLRLDFHFIDAQQSTAHLRSMGAEEVERDVFVEMLQKSLTFETLRGSWNNIVEALPC